MSAVIRFDGVWKAFPRWGGGSRTIRGIVARRVPALMRAGDQRWALSDVSFAVERGRSVGLIGANGAGKSTTLRLASGLGRPTRGNIAVPDNTASVLNLGNAFDLTLTGRENALTAAILAGVRRASAQALMPRILEFAELESFADAPMRTYSEGMKLRLAFGVIAQLEPEALLLDEVMAVGDLRFQAKCMERVAELRAGGTTVLFASHGLEEVESECDEAIWLQGGVVRAYGESAAVISEYRDAMRSDTFERTPVDEGDGAGGLEFRRNRFGSQELRIEDVVLQGPDGAPTEEISTGSSLSVSMALEPGTGTAEPPIVGIAIHRVADGLVCYDSSTEGDGVQIGAVDERLDVRLRFDRLDLIPGEYALDVGVYRPDWSYAYDFHYQAYPLRVVGRRGDKGVYRPPHAWEVAR